MTDTVKLFEDRKEECQLYDKTVQLKTDIPEEHMQEVRNRMEKMEEHPERDYYGKKIKSGHTFLSRWQNSAVQIEHAGWAGVNIMVAQAGKPGCLRICCIDPVEAHGVLKVTSANLGLEYIDGRFVVSDQNKNFKILCHDIEFKEYIK